MKTNRAQLNSKQKTYLNNLIEYYDIDKNYETLDTFIIEALWVMSDDEKTNDLLKDLITEYFIFKTLNK
jgi:hypothetical protein